MANWRALEVYGVRPSARQRRSVEAAPPFPCEDHARLLSELRAHGLPVHTTCARLQGAAQLLRERCRLRLWTPLLAMAATADAAAADAGAPPMLALASAREDRTVRICVPPCRPRRELGTSSSTSVASTSVASTSVASAPPAARRSSQPQPPIPPSKASLPPLHVPADCGFEAATVFELQLHRAAGADETDSEPEEAASPGVSPRASASPRAGSLLAAGANPRLGFGPPAGGKQPLPSSPLAGGSPRVGASARAREL